MNVWGTHLVVRSFVCRYVCNLTLTLADKLLWWSLMINLSVGENHASPVLYSPVQICSTSVAHYVLQYYILFFFLAINIYNIYSTFFFLQGYFF